MRPLITMSEEKLAACREVGPTYNYAAVPVETLIALLVELDAQRAETPREPVSSDLTDGLTPAQIKDCADAALREAREEGRRQAIDQCIVIVAASWIHGHSVVEPVLESIVEKLATLRDHPTRSTGERGEGD